MSLLNDILHAKGNKPEKKLAYLINIIKELGWDSFLDTRTIKPNLRRTQLYIRKKSKILRDLFEMDFDDIDKDNIVDLINPLLIEFWHIQIIGNINSASLQRLIIMN